MNIKEKISSGKEYLKNRTQKRFHFFSKNLLSEIIGEKEIKFKYYDKNEFKKFPIQKVDDALSINLKNKNLVTKVPENKLSNFLLLQEKLVNESGFEELLINIVKEYKANRSISIEKKHIEAILFLYWRSRRVSYDFNTFSKSINGSLTKQDYESKTNIIEEQSNIQYILDFCTFSFRYFKCPFEKIIDDYKKIYRDLITSNVNFSLNQERHLSRNARRKIASNQLNISKQDEINLIKNIDLLSSIEYDYYILNSDKGFPSINEPFGNINFMEEGVGTILGKINHTHNSILYLYLNKNEILLFVPRLNENNIKDVVNFSISSILIDPDVYLYASEDEELIKELTVIKEYIYITNSENNINKSAFETYEKIFPKIEELFNPSYRKLIL